MSAAAATPRFSAVIPAYNREHCIERAIESALAQTEPAAEIIVVDDGSRDATAARVRSYGDRVRYVHQDNAGASAARNHGVELTREPWIAFLDSDDYWLPEHLERIARAVRETQGCASLYFSDMRRGEDRGGELLWEVAGFSIPGDFELAKDASDWVMLGVQPMMLQASVFSRDAYLGAGGLWPALPVREDTHLFFKLCLGEAACAVAGCATEQTADDASGDRLTSAMGPGTTHYDRASAALYSDVLASAASLAAQHASDLHERLASAHLRLAKRGFAERRFVRLASHLMKALAASPRRTLRGAGRTFLSGPSA